MFLKQPLHCPTANPRLHADLGHPGMCVSSDLRKCSSAMGHGCSQYPFLLCEGSRPLGLLASQHYQSMILSESTKAQVDQYVQGVTSFSRNCGRCCRALGGRFVDQGSWPKVPLKNKPQVSAAKKNEMEIMLPSLLKVKEVEIGNRRSWMEFVEIEPISRPDLAKPKPDRNSRQSNPFNFLDSFLTLEYCIHKTQTSSHVH